MNITCFRYYYIYFSDGHHSVSASVSQASVAASISRHLRIHASI